MTKAWTIWLDQPITRRKSFHIVKDPEGVSTFRARFISDCIEHLDAMGVAEYDMIPLEPSDGRPPIAQHVTKGIRKWQK